MIAAKAVQGVQASSSNKKSRAGPFEKQTTARFLSMSRSQQHAVMTQGPLSKVSDANAEIICRMDATQLLSDLDFCFSEFGSRAFYLVPRPCPKD